MANNRRNMREDVLFDKSCNIETDYILNDTLIQILDCEHRRISGKINLFF